MKPSNRILPHPWLPRLGAWLLFLCLPLLPLHVGAASTPPVVPGGPDVEVRAMLAGDFVLQWPVTHDDSYQYRWYFNGSPKGPDPWIHAERSFVQFFVVRPEHEGIWQLEVVNDAGSARSPRIKVTPYDPPPPILLPPPGTYEDRVQVMVEGGDPLASWNTEFFYTTDGSVPDRTSPRVAGPIELSATATVKVRGYLGERAFLPVAEGRYIIQPAKPAEPPAVVARRFEFSQAFDGAHIVGHLVFQDDQWSIEARLDLERRTVKRVHRGEITVDGVVHRSFIAFDYDFYTESIPFSSTAVRTLSWSGSSTTYEFAPTRVPVEVKYSKWGEEDGQFMISGWGGTQVNLAPFVATVDAAGFPASISVNIPEIVLGGPEILVDRKTTPHGYEFRLFYPSFTLENLSRPAITKPPEDLVADEGWPAELSAEVSGIPPFRLRWFREADSAVVSQTDVPATGADSRQFTRTVCTFAPAKEAHAGGYRLVLDNAGGSVTSRVAQLVVLRSPPTVSDFDAAPKSLFHGDPLRLSVTSQGALPQSYQWYLDDLPLDGRGSRELDLPAVSVRDAGQYHVVVSNAYGTARSASVQVRITEPSKPAIASQPASVVSVLGGEARFSVAASGSGPLSYQWYRTGLPVAGATQSVLVLPTVRASDFGSYFVRVSQFGLSTDSDVAELRLGSPPVLVDKRVEGTPARGSSLAFRLVVQGDGPLHFAWYRDDELLSDSGTSSSLDLSQVAPGRYWVSVRGPGGTATFDLVVVPVSYSLSLGMNLVGAGRIETVPPGPTYAPGSSVLVRAIPAPGYAFLAWFSNDHSGLGNPMTLIMNRDDFVGVNFVPIESGGNVGNSLSVGGLSGWVAPRIGEPLVYSGDHLIRVQAGSRIELNIALETTLPFRRVHWFRNDLLVSTVDEYPGKLVIAEAAPGHAGVYRASVHAGDAVAESLPIEIQVATIANPKIQSQPASIWAPLGGAAQFTVVATGDGVLSYQWYRAGQPIAGATQSVLVLPKVSPSDLGSYFVRVSQFGLSTDSEVAELRLAAPPVLVEKRVEGTPVRGSNLAFRLVVQGDGPLRFDWYRDNVLLSGSGTSSNLELTQVVPGRYWVSVRGPGGTASFDLVIVPDEGGGPELVKLGPIISRIRIPAINYFEERQTADVRAPVGCQVELLPALKASGLFVRADWFRNGVPWASTTRYPGFLVISNATVGDSGVYRAVVHMERASGETDSTRLVVTTPAPPTILQQPRTTLGGVGGVAQFWVIASGSYPLKYQWYHEGHAIPTGNQSTLDLRDLKDSDFGHYFVRVTQFDQSVDSAVAELRVARPPTVLAQRVVGSLIRGAPVRFELDVEGDGPFAFDWYRDAFPLVRGTTSSFIEIAGDAVGRYWVVVSGPGGKVTRDLAVVPSAYFLKLKPAGGRIVATPSEQPYAPGTRVQLRAEPDPGNTFQWWTSDADGQQANPLEIVVDRDLEVGAHFLPTGGSVLFVNRLPAQDLDAPIFDLDGTTPLEGDRYRAQLYAARPGEELLPVGQPLPFRTGIGAGYFRGETIFVRSVPAGAPTRVQIRAWDASRAATYEEATQLAAPLGESQILTLTTGNLGSPPSLPAPLFGLTSFALRVGVPTPPRIVTGPAALSVPEGEAAHLDVLAQGTGPLIYQWFKGGKPVEGANRSRLSFAATVPADAGLYSVSVSNLLGAATSDAARLQVVARTRLIARRSDPQEPLEASPLVLSVEAVGEAPLAFQWFLGDVPIPEATSAEYRTDSARAGVYRVRISGPGGTVTETFPPVTATHLVRVSADDGGSILQEPPGSRLPEGTSLLVTARVLPGFEFLGWHGDLAGSPNPVRIDVRNPITAHASVRATSGTVLLANRVASARLDALAMLASDETLLSGEGWLAQLFDVSQDDAVPIGQPVPFSSVPSEAGTFGPVVCVVPGSPPGSFAQLEVRVWNRAAGSTFQGAVAAGGAVGQSQALAVRLGNEGTPPSTPAVLSGLREILVSPTRAPEWVTPPAPRVGWLGSRYSLTANASAHPRPGFQWYRNGTPIPGALDPAIGFTALRTEDTGEYSVRVSNDAGKLDGVFQLSVVPPIRILGITGNRALRAGQSASLRVETSVNRTLSFQWYAGTPGDLNQPLGDPLSSPAWQSPPLFQTTRAWVRASDDGGFVDSSAVVIEVQRRSQVVTVTMPPNATFGAPPLLLEANSDSGLPVEWQVSDGPGRITSDGRLELLGAGTIYLRASQRGNEQFLPSAVVHHVVLVAPRTASLTLVGLAQRADGTPRVVTATTDPPGVPVIVLYAGSATPPTAPGSYPVQARAAGPDYVGSAEGILIVEPPGWDLLGGVFEDQDANGIWTPNESGLEGVPIRLSSGDRRTTVYSDSDGRFRFPDVLEGVHTVELLNPQGFTSSTLPSQIVALGPEGRPPQVEFGVLPTESIGGTVFLDLDGDGASDAGESGIAGVRLRLTLPDQSVRTVVSQSDGRYRFVGIPHGEFTLTEEVPAGHDSTTDTSHVLTVEAGASITRNFGHRPLQSIVGVVFQDLDGNGTHDGLEPGIPGVTVHLRLFDAPERIASTTTGPSGEFIFRDLPAGDYFVEQDLPPGYVATLHRPSPALAGRPGFAAAAPGNPAAAFRAVGLTESRAASAVLGIYPRDRIAGRVFADRDGDGQPGSGEPGLGGVRIALQDVQTGSTLSETFSAADGSFAFQPAPQRRVRVWSGPLTGHAPILSPPLVSSVSGGSFVVALPYRSLGTASGRLFIDANLDGQPDPGRAGLGGIPVRWVPTDAPARTTFTAEDGSYLFAAVSGRLGHATPVLPAGWRVHATNAVSYGVPATASFSSTALFAIAPSNGAEPSAYDRWATEQGLQGAQRDPGADPDRDGLPNLLECVMGTPPSVADSSAYPKLEVLRGGDSSRPVVSWVWSRHRGRAAIARIGFEISSDLIRWSPLEPSITTLVPGDPVETIRLADPAGGSISGPRFLRWVIRQP